MTNYHKNLKSIRSGATTVEFLAVGALLATVMSFLAPFVSRVVLVNTNISHREIALREVQNVITQLQLGESPPELSQSTTTQLDSANLVIEKEVQDGTSFEKVTVSINWMNQFGEQHPPVSLFYLQPIEEGE